MKVVLRIFGATLATACALFADRAIPWEKNRIKTGQALYREHCIVCHDIDTDDSKKIGPTLFRVFQREKMPRSKVKPSRQYIAGKIRVGGPLMPSFAKKLTSDSVDLVVDYIAHVSKGEDNHE